jgi:peptide/nickel transport system substrate-binding protein
VGLAGALALALAGCTAPTIVEDSSVTVAVSQPFFSLNDRTSFGDTPANTQVLEATDSGFNRYDERSELVPDPSFGSYRLLSNDPLTVRYTIADGVTWSDGVPVDAADLLLAWAADSGVLNTEGFDDSGYIDPETGRYAKPFPRDVVHFDGATSEGLQHVTTTPEVGDGGRSLTLTWDHYVVDWPLLLQVRLPAHVVASRAFGLPLADDPGGHPDADRLRDAKAAKDAFEGAVRDDDTASLSAIANVWNDDFNLESFPQDPSLLVSTGPYTISEFVPGESVTLTANPRYHGAHGPSVETIVVRFLADPLDQVAALADGEVDVIVPRPGPEVVSELTGAAGATTLLGPGGGFEHLDLRFTGSRKGVFEDARVREAFLKTVPRQELVDAAVGGALADAAERSSFVFLPGSVGYADSIAANGSAGYERVDVPGAKALLGEAGVTAPRVCILFDPANPRRVEEYRLIKESASLAGFAVTNCSSPDWLGLLATPGTWDASLYSWQATNDSVAGLQAIFGSTGRSNTTGYSNPEVDQLLATLSVTPDPGDQRELRQRIDAILFGDAYGLPLYQNPVLAAYDDSVSGIALAPLAAGILWNAWEWTPVTEATPGPSS